MILFILGIIVGLIIAFIIDSIYNKTDYYFKRWSEATNMWGESIEDWKKTREEMILRGKKYVELYEIVYNNGRYLPASAIKQLDIHLKKYYPSEYLESSNKKDVDKSTAV